MLNVKVKLMPGAKAPTYGTPGSAGCDVRALVDAVLWGGQSLLVPTGVAVEVPSGYECQIRPRSGLALDHGITVLNSPSTIDSDFRGYIQILLVNTGGQLFKIKAGDRIAQLVFAPVEHAMFRIVDELSETQRGTGGFGSTGLT